jgi:L-asparaginase/Glu-tRNA(Gln) amidotransferase subunit D
MVVRDNVVEPAADVSEIFDMVPRIKEYADIDLKILSNVDSTNVIPDDWTKISEYIFKNRENYDGFLVAHGTNTMSYSASAVALSL